MIRIDPDTLYSREDLGAMLKPLGIDADSFIRRLKPKRVFRLAWLGKHLVEAFDTAPTLAERGGAALPDPQNRGNRGRRGGHADDMPGAKLRAFRRELAGVPD